MGILIAAVVVLFLLLLLSMPLIVEAKARLSFRGAVVHARVYLLGCIPIPIRLRVHLFSKPYFTLEIGKRRVSLLQKQNGKRQLSGIRILRLDTKTTVGIEGEPAQAVLLAGTAAVLFAMLIPRIAESGSARAALSERSTALISVRTQAIVQPVPLAFGIVRAQRIARRKAANNTRKIKEKRTTYASC